MSIQFISVKCPECGADLSIEEGRNTAFCSYCGAKVIVNNENEHIFRNIDEARIREAETDRMIKLKQLELEEKSNFSRKTLIIIWLSATALLFLIGIIGTSMGNDNMWICHGIGMNVAMWGGLALFSKSSRNNRVVLGTDEVAVTRDMLLYREKNYNQVANLLRGVGFTNIKTIPLNDLNIFTQGKNGRVETLTINGSNDFQEGDVFAKNAQVLITYHSR